MAGFSRVWASVSKYMSTLGLVFICGCFGTESKHPATTSLIDLAAETNQTESRFINYREMLAINGTLLFPELTVPVFYPHLHGEDKARTSPTFLVGVTTKSHAPSFRLSVETGTDVTLQQVFEVRKAIESVQSATLEAISKAHALQMAELKLQIAKTETPVVPETVTNLTKVRDDAQAAVKTAEEALTKSENDYRTALAAKPGLIVARWTTNAEDNTSVKVGQYGQTENNNKSKKQGYVVLGGLRASMLVFGDDFRDYVRSVSESSDRAMIDQLGFTSYLLQARHVAYTNALDIESLSTSSMSFSPNDFKSMTSFLAKIDEIKISAYVARASNLDNIGSFSDAKWTRANVPFTVYKPKQKRHALDVVPSTSEAGAQIKKAMDKGFDLYAVPMSANAYPYQLIGDTTSGPATQPIANAGPSWATLYAATVTAPKLYELWNQPCEDYPRVVNVGGKWYSIQTDEDTY